jgi:aspartyl-tRNA(Asn)/glutamyl-tRNA(Gln) amidotransferase subunit C
MKVDAPLINHLAHLARLEFNDTACHEMINDLNRILGFVEKLNEVDTEGLEPLIYMTPDTNILRADVDTITVSQDEALKNAPNKDSDYFRVPRFVDSE